MVAVECVFGDVLVKEPLEQLTRALFHGKSPLSGFEIFSDPGNVIPTKTAPFRQFFCPLKPLQNRPF